MTTPPSEFDQFWDKWPRKIARGQARRTWDRLARQYPDLLARCLAALEWQAPLMVYKMAKGEGRWIPHASTWLNAERFDDEAPPTAQLVTHRRPTDRELYTQWLIDNAGWFDDNPGVSISFEQFLEGKYGRTH